VLISWYYEAIPLSELEPPKDERPDSLKLLDRQITDINATERAAEATLASIRKSKVDAQKARTQAGKLAQKGLNLES
jgi:hypothetical protein